MALGCVWGGRYSIVDRVIVPEEMEHGDYLLSWRWDSEHTDQACMHG
jgi:hypothetical protein